MKKQPTDLFDILYEQEEITPVKTASQQDLRYEEWFLDLTPTVKDATCTCGTWSVYGKDAHSGLHKDYCDAVATNRT